MTRVTPEGGSLGGFSIGFVPRPRQSSAPQHTPRVRGAPPPALGRALASARSCRPAVPSSPRSACSCWSWPCRSCSRRSPPAPSATGSWSCSSAGCLALVALGPRCRPTHRDRGRGARRGDAARGPVRRRSPGGPHGPDHVVGRRADHGGLRGRARGPGRHDARRACGNARSAGRSARGWPWRRSAWPPGSPRRSSRSCSRAAGSPGRPWATRCSRSRSWPRRWGAARHSSRRPSGAGSGSRSS